MKALAVLALGCSLAALLPAAEDGGQPLAFSKMALGARAGAMGGADGAADGNVYASAHNPALLATLTELKVGSQWASLADGRTQQFLAFGRPVDVSSTSAYGLAYDRSALEGIEKRQFNSPDPDSTFSEAASIFTAGLAGWLWPKRLAAGASVKVLGENLGEASSGGFSLDGGFFARACPWLDLGLSFQDMTSHLTWNTGLAEDVPLVIRSSATAHTIDGQWAVSADIEKSQAQDAHWHAGAELWLKPGAAAVRAGWDAGRWSGGAGLRAALFGWDYDAGLDYALAADPIGGTALQHRISLDLGFRLD